MPPLPKDIGAGPLFARLLFELRARRVPVGMTEWMTLMRALALGLHHASLTGFYHCARSILIHSEAHFDAFDQAFGVVFQGLEGTALEITDDLLEWLKDPKRFNLSAEQLAEIQKLGLDELIRLFEERLKEQKERHDGGNKWIGTGGTSPFGHSGQHPGGLRLGGEGGGRSAMQIAGERRFKNYRADLVLDVRQIGAALRRLRELTREGASDELDLDGTIDKTCRNAGELEVVLRAARRNNVRVVLLLDVGGSMTPHARTVSRLLTAAKQAHHLRELRCYYFHNCVYEKVYFDASFREGIAVEELIHTTQRSYKLILVGDALMHPAELLEPGGAIYYTHRNTQAGIYWLKALADHFQRTLWLNPEPVQYWDQPTIRMVSNIFAMYPLTLEGLTEGIRELVAGKGQSAGIAAAKRMQEAMLGKPLKRDPWLDRFLS
ncbi:MAG: VWA domain-containing protein [bacterium]